MNELIYFLINIPIVIVAFGIILKFIEPNRDIKIISTLGSLTFIVRITLTLFKDSIGIVPFVIPNIVFYSFLAIFGATTCVIYVKYVEKISFASIGYTCCSVHSGSSLGAVSTDSESSSSERVKSIDYQDGLKKNLLISLISILCLSAFVPLMLLNNIKISYDITPEKLIIGLTFGWILGGFYEEVMFRGVIQNHFNNITSKNKSILYTALLFSVTHLGYLPFDGLGIYYWFLLSMALVLSYLRENYGQLSCFLVHGGIVFLLVIFV